MKMYTTASPSDRFGNGVWWLAIASALLVPVVLTEEWVWTILFGVFLVIIPLYQTLRRVNAIRLRDDGTIEFERILGTTRINVRDITGLTGVREDRDYGRVEWSMWVWQRAERTTVPYFEQAWDFIDDVRALNPDIPVHGEWPMPYPGFREDRYARTS